jgi:hypothetical protein
MIGMWIGWLKLTGSLILFGIPAVYATGKSFEGGIFACITIPILFYFIFRGILYKGTFSQVLFFKLKNRALPQIVWVRP